MSSTQKWLIFGAGGHGKVVADLIRAAGMDVAGFVDQSGVGRVAEPGGAVVVGLQDEFLSGGKPSSLPATVAIGNNRVRHELIQKLTDLGWELPVLIHPKAVISPSATIGHGSHVMAGAVINAAAQIGEGVIINTNATIEHDVIIHPAVHISPGAVLAGEVEVGQGAWVGAGAVVINGVEIGANAIVGAGAVVIKDVPAGATVVGNPARVIKTQ